MKRVSSTDLKFRLCARESGRTVDVRLRESGERWMAAADLDGTESVGIGATARHALTAALATLDPAISRQLLADPELFGVSTQLLAAAGR